MKFAMALLLGVAACGLCASQSSDEFKACSDAARTQAALHVCADAELRRAERELDEAARRLLSTVRDKPGAAARVKAMEQSWVAYRDAFVEAAYPAKDKQASYGTMFLVEALLTRARLTRRHTAEVRELLLTR
jgi:uncharacterized protein YecT (DUF1311 family)